MNSYQFKEGYKQTEIGVIPEDWSVHTIKETVTLINGCAFKPKDWKTQGLPIIRIQNLNDPAAFYNYCDVEVDEKYYVSFGDILFAWSGTKESSFGARVWRGGKAILNQHIFRVIPNPEKLTPHYTFLTLKRFQEDIEKKSHGFKSSFVHVKKSDLENIKLAIPPLHEQRALAQALSDVDALIAALDKLIAKKRHLKTATMQQLLTGKKRLPGFGDGQGYQQTEIGKILEDWVLTPLEKISAFITKGATPTTYGFNWVQDGVLFLRSECVSENGLDLSQSMFISYKAHAVLNRSELRSGDILITITGNVGRVVYLGNDFSVGNMNQHIARVRIISDSVYSGFVYHFLTQSSVRKAFNAITTGQAYPQISLKQVRNTVVPLPSLSEQRAIATVLSDMDAEIAALESRLAKTQAIKQGMMQELLTGRTRLL